MSGQNTLWRSALRRVKAAVLLPFVGGNLLLCVAAILGLQIPDSHSWQLLLSVLLAVGLVAGLLLWNAVAIRRMRQPAKSEVLWKGALVLGAWLVLLAILVYLVGLAEPNIETRAGYWNSQMPSALRYVLPYGRLVTLQQAAVGALRWIVLPVLFVPFLIETVNFGLSRGALRRSLRVLFTPAHLASAVVALSFSVWSVPALLSWHPAHTATGETVSVALRLAAAAVIAFGALLLLLAVDAELLQRHSAVATSPSVTD